MRRRARYLISTAVTVAAMTMVVVGTLQSSVPFVGPADLDSTLDGRRVQVEGIVEAITPESDHLVITLTDKAAGTALVHYTYADQRPLTLEEGRLVVAKGLYRDGVVQAHQVSVRAHEE
jgi:cytochrome c-type biogenesis protein CcmE